MRASDDAWLAENGIDGAGSPPPTPPVTEEQMLAVLQALADLEDEQQGAGTEGES